MSRIEEGATIGGRYRLSALLGEGGYGAVYQAEDVRTGAPVAVKFLMNVAHLRRFEVEAAALTRLDNPHCLKMLDAGEHDGAHFVVTEFADSGALRDWLALSPGLEQRIIAALQIARALQHAHAAGVLHRDLKPDNVLVNSDGYLRVADFGLAKLVGTRQPDITATGEVIGTPGFMSPEQLRGLRNVGPPSDLYCLGVIMYEMFEGEPPFSGDSAFAICMKHLREEPPTMRAVEGDLARLVARLMDKDPAKRPSATAAVLELERIAGVPSTPRTELPERGVKGGRLLVAALFALVVFVAAFAVLTREDEAPPTRPPPVLVASPTKAAPMPAAEPDTVIEPPPAVHASPGCGVQLGPGRRQLSVMVGLERVEMAAVVPKGYDRTQAHPLLIVLHEGKQTPEGVLRELNVRDLADRLGAVAVAPNGERMFKGSWKTNPTHIIAAAERFGLAAACIDPERVFLLGHGVGSRAALAAACERPFAGLVVTNLWFRADDGFCELDGSTPLLWLFPRRDYDLPPGCGQRDPHLLEELGGMVIDQYGCTDSRTRTLKHGSCVDHVCRGALTVCNVAGGVHLSPVGIGHNADCDGPPSPFDYHAEIERFMTPLLRPH